LWHSLTESGKVEVVDIKFGNKTYENVSVKHLNPTDEGSHTHKRTSKELGVKKKKSKKTEMKEQKMSDKQQYDYLLYMKKYKPDIWKDLQGNKKVRKIMKKFESVTLEELVGKPITEAQFDEAAGEKDACYRKVKARYDVWPSAYASGALVKCRKVGAANWGNSKKEGVNEVDTPMYKITYQDSAGRKKTDIMRAKNNNLAKRDFNASNKGRGFKILSVVKEGVNEKKGDFLDSLFPKAKVDKAVKIAKSMSGNMTGAVKKIEKMFKGMSKHTKVKDALQQANEGLGDKFSKRLAKYNKKNKKSRDTMKKYAKVNKKESTDEGMNTVKVWSLDEKCWKGYTQKGMKTMFGKRYPNCVKKEGVQTTVWMGENELYYESNTGESGGYTFEYDNNDLNEAEYQGRKVKLGKIMQGDTKKFKVYVKNPKGNTVKVNFGQGGDAKGGTMRIRKSNPKARKAFRARHNCDNPGPRHKARYWSCRKW